MAGTHEPRLAYLGHATLRLDLSGVRLLTDPVLRERVGPLLRQGPPLGPPDYAGTDVVLLSHLHRDHLDLGSLRLLRPRPRLVVPRGARQLLERYGFHDVVELAPGETTEAGELTIRATEAAHSGFRPPFGPTAQALGFIVESPHRRLYFAGDTDLFTGMETLGELDVALVPVWGWGPTLGPGHLDPERAAEAVRRLRPRVAVPIHWGTFWPRGLGRIRPHRLTGPALEFAERAAAAVPDTSIASTAPGDSVSLRRP
ncbi:MAG TPA: MBL fold metallo-hydrolase [Candidatus Limnocylindrales bacterium]|jgi:L-ascorbate metabolism protein UlaG (beta-lactamase superfamily)|nr:MBL fold metallo-hydrolase [Candidatus Limnocylindrales bacterium]